VSAAANATDREIFASGKPELTAIELQIIEWYRSAKAANADVMISTATIPGGENRNQLLLSPENPEFLSIPVIVLEV
jgi:hypothetical protein